MRFVKTMMTVTVLMVATPLLAGVRSAAAQSGLGAVTCVGAELETITSTNPVRTRMRTDQEVIYRTGVDLAGRDALESDLRSELDAHAEIWCAWSDIGDTHVMIIRYTGAVRLDLTLDPEDPRFQAFGVGYGTSWEEAEQFATRLDDRFVSYNDGSGYEVLVQETWSAGTVDDPSARDDAAPRQADAGEGREPVSTRSPESASASGIEETCAGKPAGTACWMEPADQPRCYVWNPSLDEGATVTWTAGCNEGFAQGTGTLRWAWDEGESSSEGLLRDGQRHGNWVQRYSDGTVYEGPYVDGKKHGNWVGRYANGMIFEGPYVNGKRHGNWVQRFVSGLVQEGPYADGKRHGNWVLRLSDGGVQEGPFVDGEKRGNWVERFVSGLVQEGPYVDFKRHGNWVERDPDGDIREGPYVNGERHGDWIELHGHGPFRVGRRRWVNGRIHGDTVRWKWSGGGVSLWTYVDGERHGIHVSCKYGERANLAWVAVYENNEGGDTYYGYDDIEDQQLARAAAAACARVLSLEQPTLSRNR